MDQPSLPNGQQNGNSILRDMVAGAVVFLVALPLCLGIALASRPAPKDAAELHLLSNIPLFAGLVTGILGGILVGILSGSHTSVSGPAAGLTAIVASQLLYLGSFEAFLLAVVFAGVLQIALGCLRAGNIAAFFPSSVIKGLLAAIGVILILKQIPHVIGHDDDPEGDWAFFQPDNRNTFTALIESVANAEPGAAMIGIGSVALLLLWDRYKFLKNFAVPAPLIVVLLGVGGKLIFDQVGGRWVIDSSHLVQVPVARNLPEFFSFFQSPDFSHWNNSKVYLSGLVIAIVATLETLLNLQAVDKLDPRQRVSPPNRELLAQGVGNVATGLLGGLPMTSVIVRSSVNINAGGRTKVSAIVHGVLLLLSVMLLPQYLNLVPLSCLAAILLVTGLKLASPALMKQMWEAGKYQFIPFVVTLLAIVLTNLVLGILIGLAVSLIFILNSNLRRPLRRIVEKHLGGDVLHIELASQVSFLGRPVLEKNLREIPRGSHVLLDATGTDFLDPDILDFIRDFKETIAPAHGLKVSLKGFRPKYQLKNEIQYVDYSTRELQELLTPAQVLEILREGNERFRTGQRLSRDLGRQRDAASRGQHPLAVILSCIDSRVPAEIIFDLGLGDIFSVRVAGNVVSRKILGSMEYGTCVVGAKLILVLGHTQCGAISTAVQLACSSSSALQVTGCTHLDHIIDAVKQSIDPHQCQRVDRLPENEKAEFIVDVTVRNVLRVVREIQDNSPAIRKLVQENRVEVVGGIYDVASGSIRFLTHSSPTAKESDSP